MDLLILTTAICRPSVHQQVFIPLIESVKKSQILNQVYHVINLDNTNGKMESKTLEEATAYILSIYKDSKIHLEILVGDPPCFYSAVKRLINRADELLKANDNMAVLYLEDDWGIVKGGTLDFDYIFKEKYKSDIFLQLSDMKPMTTAYAFRPAIWNPKLFKNTFIQGIKNSTEIKDPEVIVRAQCVYFPEVYTVDSLTIFTDIGRAWMQKIGLRKKWNKKQTFENSNLTYT